LTALDGAVWIPAGRKKDDRTTMARILVVDGEPKLVDFICRAIFAEGFSVDGATDGGHGLELIRERDYALVVVGDLATEGVDATTFLTRTMESRPKVRVLVLSVLSDVESKVRCFRLGAVDYMTKPFALAELMARIRARLGLPTMTDRRVLTNNGMRLDLELKIVETKEGTVRLSDREFLLLAHLMRCQGEVCSRAELLDKVWGWSFDSGTNVVDVYVGRIRAKLGSSVIATVRNVGYCVPVA
jgi:two-component system OmpR family response regulator